MLDQAIEDLKTDPLKYKNQRDQLVKQRDQAAAKFWVSRKGVWIGSFDYVCEALDVDPDRKRTEIGGIG